MSSCKSCCHGGMSAIINERLENLVDSANFFDDYDYCCGYPLGEVNSKLYDENFCGYDKPRPRPEPVRFDYGCSLIQVRVDNCILTGPITLISNVSDIHVAAFPRDAHICFVDEDGNFINNVSPGDTFFVCVPATPATYPITLIAYTNDCADTANADTAAPSSPMMTDALSQMLHAVGQDARVAAQFPADAAIANAARCWRVLATLTFFINPNPVRCILPRRRRCINLPGGEVSADAPFSVPCCKQRC